MEQTFDLISMIIERIVKSPNRIINRLPIPWMIYGSALAVLFVYALVYIIMKIANSSGSFNVGNDNNLRGGVSYKSMSIARGIRTVFQIATAYMSMCILYLVFSTISYDFSDNIFGTVLLIASAIVLLICQTRYCFGLPLEKSYIYAGIGILVGNLFLDIWDVGCVEIIVILLCSYHVKKLRGYVIDRYVSTVRYFKGKNKLDTYVEEPASVEIMTEITKNLQCLGEVESETEFSGNVYSNKLARGIPMAKYTNDEYLYELTKLKETRYLKSNVSYNNSCEDLKEVISNTLIDAMGNYSASSYKQEAIAKVFQAIGYDAEATEENYVKFRKTVNLLQNIYCAEYCKSMKKWTAKFDEEYNIVNSGVTGENYVVDAMKKMQERYPDMRVLRNFRFAYTEKNTAECDLLILTTGAIFCIEVKNYGQDGGYSLEISSNGTWYKRYGSQLHQIDQDPFRQNHMHAEALVQRFGKKLSELTGDGTLPPIYELVVVPNDISIMNESPNRVLHIGGLCEFIATETRKYDMAKVNEVTDALVAGGSLPSIDTEKIDFALWHKNIVELDSITDIYSKIAREITLSEKYRII